MLVDSGGWIALFSRSDSHHEEAEDLFRAAVADRIPLVTTNLVVADVQRLMLFRVGIGAARRALEVIERSDLVTLHFPDAREHAAALGWLARLEDQRLTYTDAVSFAVMEMVNSRGVLGFDRDFDVAGLARWRP